MERSQLIFVFITLMELFHFSQGDCDHLKLYPVYSEMQHQNFSLATWDNPWPPEIDWLDPYLNLSTFSTEVLQGLFIGYKISKYAKYYSSSTWGCFLMFPLDPELEDAYYLEHYAGINKTILMCTPYFPMGETFERYVTRPVSLIVCFNYELGMLELWSRRGEWSYVWDTFGGFPLVMSLSVAAVITLITQDCLVHLRYFVFTIRLRVYTCAALQFLTKCLYVTSVYHLTAISFERFFAICYPMKVRSICTMQRAKIVITILWIVSAVYAVPNAVIQGETETHAGYYCHSAQYYLVSDYYAVHTGCDFALNFVIPFALIFHNYLRISVTLFRSLREGGSLKEVTEAHNQKSKEESEKIIKVVTMLATVIVIFMMCLTPILLLDFNVGIEKIFTRTAGSSNSQHTVRLWLKFVSCVKSIANFFIYYLTSDHFKKAFNQQLRCFTCRNKTPKDIEMSVTGSKSDRKRKCDSSTVSTSVENYQN